MCDNPLGLSNKSAPQRDGPGALSLRGTVFHEEWWLNASTGGRYEEVVVKAGANVVGRLPYVAHRKLGFTTLGMPPMTHILGPVVDPGEGKPQTQLVRRLSIVRELIDKLPRHDHFKQALGSPLPDALAFQDRGFNTHPQFNFLIDCGADLKQTWDGMHFKARQHIRRAEEKFSVTSVDDPAEFLQFYYANLTELGRRSFTRLEPFPLLLTACRDRGCGEVVCARWPDGKPAAMTFLVWDNRSMYYLLSTRAKGPGDNGSVNLLIWEAIKRANALKILFDFDGVYSSGAARFLSSFGGDINIRMFAERATHIYRVARFTKRRLIGGVAMESLSFT